MRPVAHTEAEKNQGCRFRAGSLRGNTSKTTESVGGTYPHQHFVETICYAIPDNRRKTNACKKLAVGTHPTEFVGLAGASQPRQPVHATPENPEAYRISLRDSPSSSLDGDNSPLRVTDFRKDSLDLKAVRVRSTG